MPPPSPPSLYATATLNANCIETRTKDASNKSLKNYNQFKTPRAASPNTLPHTPPDLPVVVVLALLQQFNVSLLQEQFLIFNDQQRATDATSICVNANLSIADISNHRNLQRKPDLYHKI